MIENDFEKGLSRDLSKKKVQDYLRENLSEEAIYDLRLTQLTNGNYLVEITMRLHPRKNF